MARAPAALPDPELPPGDPAGSGSGAARGGWWRWVGVAGLCAVIWGGLVLAWPYWEKHRAYEIVAEHFDWDEKEKAATVRHEAMWTGPAALRELDRRTARALRVLGTKRLIIFNCPAIPSVTALSEIETLRDVGLGDCEQLTSVAGLPAGVLTLNLNGSYGLTSLAGLPPGLQNLNLAGCTGLKDTTGLPASLVELNLGGWTALTSLAGLPGGIADLSLGGCRNLTSLAGLPTGVKKIHLGYCTGLTSLTGLPDGVQQLNLYNCKGLTCLTWFPASLVSLRLRGCSELVRLENLPPALTYLDLEDCTSLVDVGSLPAALDLIVLKNTPKLPEAVKAEIRALVKKNGGEVRE